MTQKPRTFFKIFTPAGFKFGDLHWQADPSKPVAINPKGATKNGHLIDGVLADD
jgi:hypothetical protein